MENILIHGFHCRLYKSYMKASFNNSTIIMPIARCEDFALKAINHNLENSPCNILVLYDEKTPDDYVVNSRVSYLKNQNGRHFPKILNQLIKNCPTDNILYCNWKWRPTFENYQLIIDKMNEGFGLVEIAPPLLVMGFNKHLMSRIGLFDERFVGGHCVDWDLMFNMFYNDIAHYCIDQCEKDYSLATPNNPTYTTWYGNCGNRENYIKFDIKWKEEKNHLQRILKETNSKERELFKSYPKIEYMNYEKSQINVPWVLDRMVFKTKS